MRLTKLGNPKRFTVFMLFDVGEHAVCIYGLLRRCNFLVRERVFFREIGPTCCLYEHA